MARLLPEADDAELATWPSKAERRVYLACRALPASWLVIRGVRTLMADDRGVPKDGEADFTVFDPERGLLVIEVKGGPIRYDGAKDKWFGEGPAGEFFRADPFLQAMKRKKDLGRLLAEAPEWKAARLGNLPAGHAVIFPDLDEVSALRRPDSPPEIVGGRRDVRDLEGWIDRLFEFWAVDKGRARSFPEGTTNTVERLLAGSFTVRPRLGARSGLESEPRAHWTDIQWEIMRSWPSRERLAVRGGAGTGKTVLAVRRAQQLADEGKRVALLCYNAPLADHLRFENVRYRTAEGDGIDTMTFHSFARWWLGEVKRTHGRDHLSDARRQKPGRDEDAVLVPLALGWALDDQRPAYDAIIVDEGQDFGDEDWNAIETLAEGRHLAILYDPNQAVFRRAGNFPIPESETFNLHRNCRNTGAIHDAAYAHYRGPRVDQPPVVGAPVRRWTPGSTEDVADNVAGMIANEDVHPEDIVILVLDARRKHTDYAALESALARRGVPFVRETHGQRGRVLVETAGRFKGLEAAVVVLWVNGSLSEDERRRFLYVAESRARSLLVLAGPEEWSRVPDVVCPV
jgi:hypothetical protein